MEWTEALNRTIAFAEAHLRSRLTVADLAKAAGISAFHLQRGFRIITGFSLGEYVRNRRLYCATLEIANTERSILDIALFVRPPHPQRKTAAQKTIALAPKSKKSPGRSMVPPEMKR